MSGVKSPEPTTNYLGFNITLEPFTDVRVRQAFNFAVNKLKVVNRVWAAGPFRLSACCRRSSPASTRSARRPIPTVRTRPKPSWTPLAGTTGPDGLRHKNGKPLKVTLWYNQDLPLGGHGLGGTS